MLLDMALEVGLHGELSPALVADIRLEALMGAHVLTQQILPQIGLQVRGNIFNFTE
jgi:hypothetical protein